MGGVLQDSLNEMGSKQARGSNPLQAIMGNLGGLQQSIQAEWSNQEQEQEQDFKNFGKEVCNCVISLEDQRKKLVVSGICRGGNHLDSDLALDDARP